MFLFFRHNALVVPVRMAVGCGGMQSMLDPAAKEAAPIAELF